MVSLLVRSDLSLWSHYGLIAWTCIELREFTSAPWIGADESGGISEIGRVSNQMDPFLKLKREG
jgi:hypothetical protein